jgi:hypothetical protein
MDQKLVFVIVVVLILLFMSRSEYFQADADMAQKVLDGIIVANNKELTLDEFRAMMEMPNFKAYTFMLMMSQHKEGSLTKEKVEKYLIGDFTA